MLDAMDRYFVVAADTRRVRWLPEVAERCTFLAEALLSPDGTRLAVSGETDVLILDLTTGEHRLYPIDEDGPITVLAWSPDSRLVACSNDGDLVVLELPLGRVRPVDLDGEECSGAAFSPDTSRLAVDLDEGVGLVVFAADGSVANLVSLPTEDGEELSGTAAWSPDGRLLAVERARPDLRRGLRRRAGGVRRLIHRGGPGRAGPVRTRGVDRWRGVSGHRRLAFGRARGLPRAPPGRHLARGA